MFISWRFSNTVEIGMRVPRNTHAPLRLPGMLSTAAHCDRSRVSGRRALEQLRRGEEEGDFDGGGFVGVGAVDAVALDGGGEYFADGALGGVSWVGRAHGIAPLFDGVLGFEHQDYDGAFGHELDQRCEEGALAVDAVEAVSYTHLR